MDGKTAAVLKLIQHKTLQGFLAPRIIEANAHLPKVDVQRYQRTRLDIVPGFISHRARSIAGFYSVAGAVAQCMFDTAVHQQQAWFREQGSPLHKVTGYRDISPVHFGVI